jgi:hypothetical protein
VTELLDKSGAAEVAERKNDLVVYLPLASPETVAPGEFIFFYLMLCFFVPVYKILDIRLILVYTIDTKKKEAV